MRRAHDSDFGIEAMVLRRENTFMPFHVKHNGRSGKYLLLRPCIFYTGYLRLRRRSLQRRRGGVFASLRKRACMTPRRMLSCCAEPLTAERAQTNTVTFFSLQTDQLGEIFWRSCFLRSYPHNPRMPARFYDMPRAFETGIF